MEQIIGAVIGILIAAVISGAVIWLVSKLDLGLRVDNFVWAMIAGLMIGFISTLVLRFMTDFGGLGGLLVHLVVSAGVILASGQLLKGLQVKGLAGALLAAVAIAVVNYGLVWLVSASVSA